MPKLNEPFYVSFDTDPVPGVVDHSQPSPGPSASDASHAGFTNFKTQARLIFAWNNKSPRSDGTVPFFAESINVYFRLTDFAVAISSNYPEDSCAYDATRQHEFYSHVMRPRTIFYSYCEILVAKLNALTIPTATAPRLVRPAQIEEFKGTLEGQVTLVVGSVRRQLLAALQADRDFEDRDRNYRLIHAKCSDAEWARGSGP